MGSMHFATQTLSKNTNHIFFCQIWYVTGLLNKENLSQFHTLL